MLTFQIKSKTNPERLIDVVESLDKHTVYNVLQVAIVTGIDVEIDAIETHKDSQTVKFIKILDTSIYRKLGIIQRGAYEISGIATVYF